MRPHLVRINSTITEQAPLVFNMILLAEILLCCILLIGSPLFCVAASRVGAIHRNFRCLVCSASIIYLFGILARFVLIYYQLHDVPLTDDDPVLLVADLLRDLVIGYHCGSGRILCANTDSDGVLEMGMFFSFTKNARLLVSLSTSNISHASYTVGRSYQIRENIFLMKYIVNLVVPSAIIASPCFICFAFNEYGPEDWLLSRSIAYAVWDLFFVIFRVFYLYRECMTHPRIFREFRNLVFIQILRMKVIPTAQAVMPKIEIAPSQTYFDQFKEAWR